MTTAQLALRYKVTPRTIRRDCEQKIYPYTIKAPGENTQLHFCIQPYIPFYARNVWRNLKRRPPTKYGDQEREAFILAHGHKLSIRAIATHLLIQPDDVRRLYTKLLTEGRITGVHVNAF